MNKYINKFKKIFTTNRTTFIFFVVLISLGILFGSLFITILDKSDKELVTSQITQFFTSYKTGEDIDIICSLKNSLFSNILSVLGVWILGISVIGIPLIILFLFVKGFIFGFSIGGIIYTYGFKGILLSFGYLFPHQFINLIIFFVLSYVSFNLSLNFFKNLLTKRTMDFKIWTGKYYKLLFITLLIAIISSVIEVFISPYILKLLSNLV